MEGSKKKRKEKNKKKKKKHGARNESDLIAPRSNPSMVSLPLDDSLSNFEPEVMHHSLSLSGRCALNRSSPNPQGCHSIDAAALDSLTPPLISTSLYDYLNLIEINLAISLTSLHIHHHHKYSFDLRTDLTTRDRVAGSGGYRNLRTQHLSIVRLPISHHPHPPHQREQDLAHLISLG